MRRQAWHLLRRLADQLLPQDRRQDRQRGGNRGRREGWLDKHPDFRKNDAKLRQFIRPTAGWAGRQGPALADPNARSTTGAAGGRPRRTAGTRTMQEYDGRGNTPFTYEYGYSQGYRGEHPAPRAGERLTRNWFNKGLHVNGILHDGDAPGCLHRKVGARFAGLPHRVRRHRRRPHRQRHAGYDVPLADGGFRSGAWKAENLACQGRATGADGPTSKTPPQPGVLEIRCPELRLPGRRAGLRRRRRRGRQVQPSASPTTTGWTGGTWPRLEGRAADIDLSASSSCGGTTTGSGSCCRARARAWTLRRSPMHVQCSQRALPPLDTGRQHDQLHRRPGREHRHRRRQHRPQDKGKNFADRLPAPGQGRSSSTCCSSTAAASGR